MEKKGGIRAKRDQSYFFLKINIILLENEYSFVARLLTNSRILKLFFTFSKDAENC